MAASQPDNQAPLGFLTHSLGLNLSFPQEQTLSLFVRVRVCVLVRARARARACAGSRLPLRAAAACLETLRASVTWNEWRCSVRL